MVVEMLEWVIRQDDACKCHFPCPPPKNPLVSSTDEGEPAVKSLENKK